MPDERGVSVLWDDDPSPSFDEMAQMAGIELPPPTSPEDPAMHIDWQVQAFWPVVPDIAQEARS